MSDLYDRMYDRVRELRAAGIEPDRVVIPGDDWSDYKDAAEVNEGEGVMGGDEVLTNGVPSVWSQTSSKAEVLLRYDADE